MQNMLVYKRILNYTFLDIMCLSRSWDSSVGAVMGHRLDDRGSIPDRGKRFFHYFAATKLPLGTTQPPIQWVLRDIPQGANLPGSETDHSCPSASVVNTHGRISYSFTCLHSVVPN